MEAFHNEVQNNEEPKDEKKGKQGKGVKSKNKKGDKAGKKGNGKKSKEKKKDS